MSWLVVSIIGGVIGLAAAALGLYALLKMPAPKKWGALVLAIVLGLAGAYLAVFSTAIVGPDVTEEIPVDDFDAPLDDDF